MKFLVVDDAASNRMLLKAYLVADGHSVVFAENGEIAIQVFKSEKPDIILMDILMPVMNGYDATMQIKEISGAEGKFIPVIFLTAMTTDEALQKCIAVGGDDFLGKPYNQTILSAKIEALNRLRKLYNTVKAQKDELALHHMQIKKEQSIARKVFDSIVSPGCLGAENIKIHISPMALFNGDLFLAAVPPTGGMYLLMGDFTGHGLAASLGALPVSDIFYAMTAKAYSIENIAREINNKMKKQLPTGMFLAACLIDFDINRNLCRVWNGGIPAAFFYAEKEKKLQAITSKHLPLGIIGDQGFNSEVDIFPLYAGDKCYLSTDGILEANNCNDEMFGIERFEKYIRQYPDKHTFIKKLLEGLDTFTDKAMQADDFTVMVAEFDPLSIKKMTPEISHQYSKQPSHWKFSFELAYDSLKKIDPIPLLNQLLSQMEHMEVYQSKISTILTELFINALDHGLLKLNSNIKSNAEGFIEYYQEREKRLASLKKGMITFILEHKPLNKGGELSITVKDTGEGFDLKVSESALQDNNKMSGRGIPLLKNLCDNVRYNKKGNRVYCQYTWNEE